MNELAVVVLSFDKYSDLWTVYFDCAKRFWKTKLPVFLVTNEKRPIFENVQVITTGPEISWSHRARKAVEKVDAKYIFLMLEDYYVVSNFTDAPILSLASFMEDSNADYMRVYPFPQIKFKDAGVKGIHRVPEDTLYGVNLQPSIWKKDYLLRLLGQDDFSAWEFEARQKNGVTTQIKGNLYTLDYELFKMVNGVLQGKWYTPSLRTLESVGIHVDTSKRAVLPWSSVIAYKSKIFIRKVVGPNMIRKVKPILKKMGVKFVTE